MIPDGIDAALLSHLRKEEAGEAEFDAEQDLLAGDFNPFIPRNLSEAMSELCDSDIARVCACLFVENYALAGAIMHDLCIDYWTIRASDYVKAQQAKQKEDFEHERLAA